MTEPLISVIIPTYNRTDDVVKAVESVAAQTHKNLEIIVVDDGSKDNTIERLKAIQKNEPRLQIISQKNAGVSTARNLALSSAKGDYFALHDDDDRSLPERLETQLRRVQELERQSPGTPIICTSDYIGVHLEADGTEPRFEVKECAGCENLDVALRKGFPPPSTWFFPRRTYEALSETPRGTGTLPQLFDPSITAGEDAELLLRARKTNVILSNVNEPLVLYTMPQQGKEYGNSDQQIASEVRKLEKHGDWIWKLPPKHRNEMFKWFDETMPRPIFEDMTAGIYERSLNRRNPADGALSPSPALATGRSTLRQIPPGVNVETADAAAGESNTAKGKKAPPSFDA